jgi:putative hemolysin
MAAPSGAAGALVWAVGLLLVAAFVLSVLSAMLERTGPIRLRHWAEEAGGRLRDLYDEPIRFGTFRSLLSVASRATPIALFFALWQLLATFKAVSPGGWAFGLALALLAAIEVTNRLLVGHDPEAALRALTRLYRAALFVATPLVAALAPLVPARDAERDGEDDEDEASDEEIAAFIDVGEREGILEPEEGKWVSNIVGFGETQVRSVMTPRIDMVCSPVGASLDEVAERFVESGHSRIPLYEASIDHIVGVLHIRDVLRALRAQEPPPRETRPTPESQSLRTLANPPLFVPETKPLAELLKEFQSRFQELAIVVDEYGGTAGLVTVEDLIEEIVGEIADEHDPLASEIEPVADGVWRLDGRTHIETLDELFGVEIEEPEYETVAGLIFSALGHVPHVGETVEQQGLRFTVEGVADRRIQSVRVERVPEPREEGAVETSP